MPNVTLATLQDRVYSRLDGNFLFYPRNEVTSAINDSVRIANLFTGFLQGTQTIVSVANRVWYLIPPPILIPLRVQFENTYLQPISIRKIGQSYQKWVTETTNEMGPVARWIPFGLDKFAIHPADAQGGSLIQVTGILEPTPLVNLTDTLSMPNEFTDIIDLLTTHVLQMKEGPPMLSASSGDYNAFVKKIQLLTIWRNWTMPKMKEQMGQWAR